MSESRFRRTTRGVLWPPLYFAASVGCVSESTVRGYNEHQ